MRRILPMGLEAFGTTPMKPAETVAWLLDREVIAEAEVTSRIIPNSFFECIEVVKAAIAEEEPVAVVIMGDGDCRADCAEFE